MGNARIICIGIIVSSSLVIPKVIPSHFHAMKQFIESWVRQEVSRNQALIHSTLK
jgi:hypothetical protein